MYCWLLLQIYFMTDFVVQGHIFYKSFIALDIGVSQLSAWLFIDADIKHFYGYRQFSKLIYW